VLVEGPIPAEFLTAIAGVALFAVLFHVGIGVVPREWRGLNEHAALVGKALFCVFVAVPAIAIAVSRAAALPREAEIGIVLMAISPGAPIALRRALGAGAHHALAPALQILVAVLAVASMPLSIVALDEVYAGHATVAPSAIARQVLFAQVLPLALGAVLRYVRPDYAERLDAPLRRFCMFVLGILSLAVLVDVWPTIVEAGWRVTVAIVLITTLSLGAGHLLGGRHPGTRTAVAIVSAARNPGLALLVAALNGAPPRVVSTVLAYLVVSGITLLAYVAWRRARSRALIAAR
jgi:BASS family bile acid:Na+ symporter